MTSALRTSAASVGTFGCPLGAAGRWQIDGERSTLNVAVRIGALATVRGRFTDVSGEVTVGDELEDGEVLVSVRTSSLTSGRGLLDSMLIDAGIVDTRRNPYLGFSSAGFRNEGNSWLMTGVLATSASVLGVTLRMGTPELTSDGDLRAHATGEISSRDAVALLSRPGLERMLGRTMSLDLAVVAVPG